MKQKLSGFLTEWIAFTLMFFFLYDIFWALADIEDLKHTLSTISILRWILSFAAFFP
mgnify:CR=1 FL=1